MVDRKGVSITKSLEQNDPPADLLAILVCPLTKTPLVYDRVRKELLSYAAGLAYPVRNGIPVLLREEARVLSKEASEREG